MNSEINNVEFEAIRNMQSHLSKRGLNVSQRKLMDVNFILRKGGFDAELEMLDIFENHDRIEKIYR